MTLMTLLSRVLGLVREQVRALYLGTGAASDAFGLAATIPNLFRRLLAEGAMTAAFVPVFAEYLKRGDEEATRAFLSRFVTLLTMAVSALVMFGVLITPWLIETFFSTEFKNVPGKVQLTIWLTQLMWPYLGLVSVAAVIQAILNTEKIFAPSAFTPVLLNACIIGCGIGFADAMPDPAYGLVAGFLLGGAVQIVFQIPFLLRWTRVRFGPDFRVFGPGVRRVLWIMVPGIWGAGIYQINVFVSQLIASTLDGGSIASLQYGIRLQELVLGLFVVSVAQVILPTLSHQSAEGDADGVRDTLAYAIRLMAYVTLPSTVALVLLGAPIVRLLFEFGAFDAESTAKTAYAVTFYALGLLPIALARVQAQVFFAHKDQKTPALVASVVALVNIVLCIVLSGPLGHGGIALAGSVAAVVNTAIFAVLLRRQLGSIGGVALWSRVLRVGVATALMSGALYGYALLSPHAALDNHGALALWVLGACAIGASSYVVACRGLGVDELGGLWAALRRRGKKTA